MWHGDVFIFFSCLEGTQYTWFVSWDKDDAEFQRKNLECFQKNDKYLNEEINEMQSQLIN